MRVRIQVVLAVVSVMALATCGDDDDSNGDEPKAGSGAGSGAGKGGSGDGDGDDAGIEGGAGGGGAPAVEHMCVDGSAETCPTATGQPDGVPCCTKMTDITTSYVATGIDHCGLLFPDRTPCFELAAPGVQDDQCPQNLDAGDGHGAPSMWGRHEGCCHSAFMVCGILQPDTGCTLFRPSALTPDGMMIGGMGSGDYPCQP
jgi:hypothetical protein